MKVIKNYWKSCLCFLLAFLCIISSISFTDWLNVNAYNMGDLSGGGTITPYVAVHDGLSDTPNEGAPAGDLTGINGLRLRAIPLADEDAFRDNPYYSLDSDDNLILNDGNLENKIEDGYYSASDWIYITANNVKYVNTLDKSEDYRTAYFFDGSMCTPADTYALDAPKGFLDTFMSYLDISSYEGNADDANEAEGDFVEKLNSKIPNMRDNYPEAYEYLREWYDIDEDQLFIVVLEALHGFGTSRDDKGWYNVVWFSETSYNNDRGLGVGYIGYGDKSFTSMSHEFSQDTHIILGDDDKPLEGKDITPAGNFLVYAGLAPEEDKNKSLANISVTYTGAPNTSNKENFNSAGTVGGYFDGSLKSWNGEDWDSEFNLNMSTVESNYTLVFSGATELVAGQDVDISDIVDRGNNMGSFTLDWKTSEVNGDIHAGVTSKVSSVDYFESTQAISDRALIKDVTQGDFYDCTGNEHPTGKSSIENSIRATYTKAANWYSSDEALTKKGVFRKDETIGLGTEFIAKGQNVTSTHYIITLSLNGSSVTSEELNYTTSTSGSIVTRDNAIALVVAPKFDGNADPDYVRSELHSYMSPDEILSSLTSRIRDSVAMTTDASSRNVTVGHDTSHNNDGFVIYEVVSSIEDGSDSVNGETKLEDWFLNKYTNNILETAYKEANQNSPFHFGINYSHTVDTSGAIYENADCGESLLVSLGSNYKDYRITYNMSRTGTEADWDSSRQKIYYPASASSTFNGLDSMYKFPITINTLTYNGSRNIDYAFNFVRSATGDIRSISGISYTSYNDIGDSANTLKIADSFGVVPTKVVTEYEGKKLAGKEQLVGTTGETFTFDSIFTRTGNVWGLKSGYTAIHKDGEDHEYGDPEIVTDEVTQRQYKVYNVCSAKQYLTDPIAAQNVGLVLNVSALHNLTYNLTGKAYKYQAVSLSEGKNSLLDNSNVKGVAIGANKPTGATSRNTNEYRFATVSRNSNVNLSFYPENYMVCKIGGTVFDSNPYKYVSVISEIKRQAESSSLYLIKVNTDADADSTITGSTYSDTMQGGTSSVTSNKVSIPAGSDVTVLADTSNINVDLYGYALDLIDKSKDSSMKIGANSSKSYNSVVKSGADLINAWGNDESHAETLKSNFITWADNVMKLENFGADFTLDVNNNTKGANFSATIGKANHVSGATEDGVYNIVVENGAIVESSGAYQQMITQLAADYECSYDEANALFKDSQIYTSILNAIESSTSNFNTSGKTTGVADSWTSTLGNDNNWYDEKVRTFVVRRYTNLGNTLSDITATDKLDYSLAPTGNNSGKENASAGTTYDAKWSLSLFFNSAKKSELDNLIFENGNYFDPSSSTDITGANNAYTVLINKTPVNNADFLIPASSTSNFGF